MEEGDESRLHQNAPQVPQAEAPLGEAEEERADGPDRAGLDRREETAVEAAEHQRDQRRDRQALGQKLPPGEDGLVKVVGTPDEPGREGRHRDDPGRESDRQQQARSDPGDEQVADALLGQDAVEDQEERGRDQHAEDARSRDDADGEAWRVAVADHLRHGDLGEDGGRGNGDAGDRGEDRVGPDGSHAQTAPESAEGLVGDVEGVATHSRFRDDEPHQHEERHDAEKIACDRVVCRQRHQLARENG